MNEPRKNPDALIFRHHAMATSFELHIPGHEPAFAKSVAQEAFRLLDHLESLLSRYREESEVSIISRLQPGENFIAAEEVFDCLALALAFSQQTMGAFDVSLGREMDRNRGVKESEELPRGRLLLATTGYGICCEEAPVSLDLGAIGKGYALDRMALLLKEWGIEQALLGGGGSSLLTLAEAGDTEAPLWSVGLEKGNKFWLQNGAVGCSGIAVQGAHIIDPQTKKSARGPERVWVLAPTAAQADAYSTAFMVLPLEKTKKVVEGHRHLAVALQKKLSEPVEWLVPPVLGVHGAFAESKA